MLRLHRLGPGPLLLASLVTVAGCSSAASTTGAIEEPSAQIAQASSGALTWMGYTWDVTSGGMAGIAQGDPSNVSVDASGYLHLKITKNGTTWTAAEIVSETNLGFGTYQWQISGPIDRMDHTVVLGLAPYGPAAGIGTDGYDEIDTEFSYWNDEIGHVNMDWGVYPADSKGKHEEDDFFFSLNGGTQTTARMVWSAAGTVSTVMSGFQPIAVTANVLNTQTYAPTDPTDEIPQQAVPMLINLWVYEAAPSSGNDVEVVLQDFEFVPEGQALPDAGPSGADDGGSDDAASPTKPTNDAGVSDDAGALGSSDAGGGVGIADAAGAAPSEDAASGTQSGAGGNAGSSGDAGAPSSGGSGGCTVGAAPRGPDPLAVLACLGAIVALARRRQGR
jgi:hypothetical protein